MAAGDGRRREADGELLMGGMTMDCMACLV